jgi:hypothetical protein
MDTSIYKLRLKPNATPYLYRFQEKLDRTRARTRAMEGAAMTDALLLVLVVGVVALALTVDLTAVIGWLRRMIEP